MKKILTMKKMMLTVGVSLLTFVGLNAQVADNNYVQGGSAATAGQQIDTVTVNTQTGYYAQPDPYYNPNYNAGGSWALNSGETWTWTDYLSKGTVQASGSFIKTGAPANYVEVKWGATAGLDSLGVTEGSSLACSGSNSYIKVQVVAAPTIAFTSGATYFSSSTTVCENDPSLSNKLGLNLTGIPSYRAYWSLSIKTVKADGTPESYYQTDESTTMTSPDTLAVDSATTKTTSITTAQTDITKPTGGFVCIKDASNVKQTTVYSYTIYGVNDRISRKSDYLTNTSNSSNGWTWYNTTPQTVVITVNPAPVTGPIYHISNTWAN